ncbi:MAG: hypothetical protein RQ761_10395 [Bacteroidales bacterium]|nr:hypothetical protein [Bacteroidales bacterium]
MIRIIVNNQEVFLDPKTSLRFDLIHPAFESEYLHASMIYPFDIPSYGNEQIFQHANHIVVNNKYRVYDCLFSFAGVINFTGKLILNKLTKHSFRGSIIMNGFAVDSKDISLKDFSYDSDVNLGSTTAQVAAYIEENVYNSYPDVNFNFPLIYVPSWYGKDQEHNQDFQDYVNFWLRSNDLIRQNIISETSPDNYNSLLPCIYLMYVVKKCFAHLGFQTTGDFLTHPELSQLVIFYNVPLDFGQKKYTVKAYNKTDQSNNSLSTQRLSFPDDYTPPYEDDDDCWDNSAKEYTIQREGFHDFSVCGQYRIDQGMNDYQHLVSISIYDTTEGESIASLLLDPPVYNADTDFVVNNSSIWIPASKIGNKISALFGARHLEMPGPTWEPSLITIKQALLDVKNLSFCNFNSFKKNLRYADHLPDISFGDLIAAISKAFGLYLLFDHEKSIVEINFLNDLICSIDTIDLSERVINNSHEIILKDNKGYSYQFKWDGSDYPEEIYFSEFNLDKFIGEFDCWQDLYIPTDLNVYAYVRNLNAICVYVSVEGKSEWAVHSYYYKPFIKSPSKSDISIGFSPLMMDYNSVVDKLTPSSEIKCSSQLFPTGVNNCGLHLLFYRGLDNQTYDYPFATPLTLDRFGDQQWNISLRLEGAEGLMEKFLQRWLDFQDKSIEVKMDFNIDEQTLQSIMQIFLPNPGKTRPKIHVHNIDYIPKKFSIMLSMNGIQSCQGNLIKEGMIEI